MISAVGHSGEDFGTLGDEGRERHAHGASLLAGGLFAAKALSARGPARGLRLLALALLGGVASCGPAKIVEAPPPPPPVVVIPPRPMPPVGAAPNMVIPALAADGLRHTVNTGVSPAQAVWNLRSAYNVAALNCMGAQYAPILPGYADFQKRHAKALAAANKTLDKEYRTRFGAKGVREREAYQTQVYNFFALPPVVPALCNAALALTVDLENVPAGQLDAFAPSGLAKAEAPFTEFYNSYEQYRADLAAWEARFGAASAAAVEATPLAAAR
ncbi:MULTISPECIES: hypothetical protein [Novosphingobium]|uniref:hypothetical protein n=1 Tax=unclassified Novosphingobium TaxID=2644732 RepID=UPI0010436DA3|nr:MULTISPECIES: hypothetical protein [unclassified Novosphingobium]MPS70489.1 hypothetical protein [Novosphingobium sp.]TCM34397.1 hypothetical protein EDF59_11881 [Novosphingobium sp. ST904]WRT96039.1 hypothetical protein U9J33_20880 [Novosphingobium sp. RL4]